MTLNGVMALILPYFTEFLYDVVVKKFTFAVTFLMSFLSFHSSNMKFAYNCRSEGFVT